MKYRIVNKGKSAELYLYGYVGGWDEITDTRVASDLKSIGKVDVINVRLNSFGGDVTQGYAIYNLLLSNRARVEVDIDGAACSIASIIACAGDVVRMARNALYMIHDPAGVAVGNAADMRATADVLDLVRGQLVDTYVKRTGLTAQAVSDYMTAETWFKAADAAQLGFVDQITDELKIAACTDLSKFRNVPTWAQKRAGPDAAQHLNAAKARLARL